VITQLNKKLGSGWWLFLAIPILSISYLLAPLTGDVIVSIGASVQADYLEGNWFQKIYNSWNLRGIGYKFVIFFLYKISQVFQYPWQDNSQFQFVFKFIYMLFMGTILFCSYKILKPVYNADSILKKYSLATLLVILCGAYNVIGEPEEIAFVLSCLMISFGLSHNKWLNSLTGLFLVILFSLKAVTIVFASAPTLIFILLLGKQKLKTIAISYAGFTLLGVGVYFQFLGKELNDLYEATKYQTSFTLTKAVYYNAKGTLQNLIAYQPMVLFSLILFPFIKYSKIDKKEVAAVVLVFITMLLVMTLQGRFFNYHFIVLYPIAVWTWYQIVMKNNHYFKKLSFKWLLVFPIGCYFFFSWVYNDKLPANGPTSNNQLYIKQNFEVRDSIYSAVSSTISDPTSNVLYLTDGAANYFMPNPSHLRHFYPLPLQRIVINNQLPQLKAHQNDLNSILTYQGDFVLVNHAWFKLSFYPNFIEKLETEYELVLEHNRRKFTAEPVQLYKRKNI
jgi:hypothetical protein|tara:strand:+ start:8860 stop:10374 length:1515 start_codon:yes stop_codon:yes gene_type:complete